MTLQSIKFRRTCRVTIRHVLRSFPVNPSGLPDDPAEVINNKQSHG